MSKNSTFNLKCCKIILIVLVQYCIEDNILFYTPVNLSIYSMFLIIQNTHNKVDKAPTDIDESTIASIQIEQSQLNEDKNVVINLIQVCVKKLNGLWLSISCDIFVAFLHHNQGSPWIGYITRGNYITEGLYVCSLAHACIYVCM